MLSTCCQFLFEMQGMNHHNFGHICKIQNQKNKSFSKQNPTDLIFFFLLNQKAIQVHYYTSVKSYLANLILKSQCFLAERQSILGSRSAMHSCTTKATVTDSRLIILLVHKGYSTLIFIITHEVLKN